MTHPYKIPGEYSVPQVSAEVEEAYDFGLSAGHGLACQNVPTLNVTYRTVLEGRQVATEDNIRTIHFDLCYGVADGAHGLSPYDAIAEDYDDVYESEDRWAAYDAGVCHAVAADIATYTDEDYGIEADEETL